METYEYQVRTFIVPDTSHNEILASYLKPLGLMGFGIKNVEITNGTGATSYSIIFQKKI